MKKKKGGTKAQKLKNYCNICQKTVKGNTYKFKSHLYHHKAIEPRFTCPYCNKEFFRSDSYKVHIAVHNGTVKKHICDYCDRGFVDKRNLHIHMKVHDDSLFDNPYREYKCIACGIKYSEKRLLDYHVRKNHFNLKNDDSNDSKDNKKNNETWVENVNNTESCVQMTKLNNNVIKIQKCNVKLESKCEIKNDLSYNEYMNSVFANEKLTHYSKAVCDYCKKEMLKKSIGKHIKEAHLKLKKFKCDDCGRAFSRPYQMTQHICGKPVHRRRKTKTDSTNSKL